MLDPFYGHAKVSLFVSLRAEPANHAGYCVTTTRFDRMPVLVDRKI
jgi:hypothetical protein